MLMRTLRSPFNQLWRIALGAALVLTVGFRLCPALDKPTGAPLVLSSIETEQPVPLAYLAPDGKTAHCTTLKLHWNPNMNVGPDDDATSFTLDIAADNPVASIFTAQLWNASLASALAWQQPWQGARWKVLQTPATDGTGIDAALAVGMIATSARRPYPVNTAVIGSLNPDGSLGPVSHLIERMDAAAAAGITRVIIPGVQRFDTDATGQVVNMVRHASDLHLDCVPVDNLVEATETAMNDPLPDVATGPSSPSYGNDIAGYIDDFAHHEESEATGNLKFAPKEADLTHYPPRIATIWKSVYADVAAAQQAYRAGQVYVAYRLYARANASMSGVNALVGQDRAVFDVKAALSESDDLRNHLHALMNPPAIDKDDLQSALLVAEMADWTYDINASLEGAQLVTKQTFSQRSDATDAEKDRAREAILFAIEQSRYLLNQADFYSGLLTHLGKEPIAVDENAAHLLPQLIPAQLATARVFTDGIRTRANELRDGLLFDPRLVAYVNVLREASAEWNARVRKQEMDAENSANTPDTANPSAPGATPLKPNSASTTTSVAFDPGDTYRPPHTVVAPTSASNKLSNVAQCLIWVNNDCEIATLDEKYLRLSGIIDPATHEWHVKDRAKLDALLQTAEAGARQGIAFAEKAEVDSSVLSMIYERAAHLRIQDDDASALEALRNYWRCALLGNMCWQLAHSHKAQPVDLTATPPDNSGQKPTGNGDKKTSDKTIAGADNKTQPPNTPPVKPSPANANPPPASTNTMVVAPPPTAPVAVPPVAQPVVAEDPPVAPIATNETEHPAPPRALPVTDNSAPPAPVAATPDETNIPVAPIARSQDYAGTGATPATNAPPVIGPVPPANKSDNSDGHTPTFP
jgi:hypothetical protein